jgi:MFS family permease
VWLDRVRKLPVYVVGEISIALTVASVPLAWWMGWLSMNWLYLVGFVIGAVNTTAGSAAQIVLTQIVPRERLVEAHAKNALATSTAEVTGPAAAGALIKITGAPLALLADAILLLVSATDSARRLGQGDAERRNAPFWPRCGRASRSCAATPARHHGELRRCLADVQSGGDGRADLVCDATWASPSAVSA